MLGNLLSNIEFNPREGDQLMHHPLLESFILRKWQKVKKLFNIQFMITFVFVVASSIVTSLKCLSNKTEETEAIHDVLGVLVIPLLVEIILVETYRLKGVQQIKVYWLQALLKVTVLGLAIVNTWMFRECTKITRDVKFYKIVEKILS